MRILGAILIFFYFLFLFDKGKMGRGRGSGRIYENKLQIMGWVTQQKS
jgi:hypothetical protein